MHLSVIRILRLRSASEILIAGLVGFRFLLDSGLPIILASMIQQPTARQGQDKPVRNQKHNHPALIAAAPLPLRPAKSPP